MWFYPCSSHQTTPTQQRIFRIKSHNWQLCNVSAWSRVMTHLPWWPDSPAVCSDVDWLTVLAAALQCSPCSSLTNQPELNTAVRVPADWLQHLHWSLTSSHNTENIVTSQSFWYGWFNFISPIVILYKQLLLITMWWYYRVYITVSVYWPSVTHWPIERVKQISLN